MKGTVMLNTDLIKELRALTQAGMSDCKNALEKSEWNLDKALDLIKTQGLNIASGREGRVTSDGIVLILNNNDCHTKVMVEVNCQTDFVSRGIEFINFVNYVASTILDKVNKNQPFSVNDVEDKRKALIASSKENIVVSRWWVEQAVSKNAKVFTYVHSNNRIGVMLTMLAGSEQAAENSSFNELGADLAMQIAAMNPLVVSDDRLNSDELERQKNIFEIQLAELNKPQTAWAKILEGKFNKWYTEVCLLNQESVIVPKTTIKQIIKNVENKLGSEIKVVNFILAQVGDIAQVKENLADEVSKLLNSSDAI